MRRIVLAVIVFLPGCFLPYAAPSLSYVPPFDLECPAGEVHAFRVNITRTTKNHAQSETIALKEIGVDGMKKTAGQTGLEINRGRLTGDEGTSHTIAVRLYRPGFETVELNSWDSPGKVIWKPALTAAVQELALDDLFDLGNVDRKDDQSEVERRRKRMLEPGSVSEAHRAALRFGAAEYARLAGQIVGKERSVPTAQQELRDRLVAKARRLEQLAAAR